MEEAINTSLAKIKQPSPSFNKDKDSKGKQNKKPTMIAHTPIVSTMPFFDTYVRKKQEHPKLSHKIQLKKEKLMNFDNILSLGIVALGCFSLGSIVKNTLKFLKEKK